MLRRTFVGLLTIPAIALAGWVDKSGEKLPETSFRKASGDFVAQLVLVGDEDQLFRRWATPANTVEVKSIDAVGVGQPISAFIVFGGCKPGSNGQCSVTMRFRVLKPDGGTYAETPPMEVWDQKPVPPGRSLGLSVDYLKVVIEPKDSLGRYLVQSQVRDNNSGTVLQLEAPFQAHK